VIRLVVALLALAGVYLAAPSFAQGARPNVLFVITDDQSAAHLGCYGDRHINTPNIDRLAREGVRFESAFTACPSCTPSRSALLTGQQIYRLEEAGLLMGRLLPKLQMWTLDLQNSGYTMGSTGKTWGPGLLPAAEFPVHPFGKAYNQKKAEAPPGVSPNDYAANFEQFLDERPRDKPFTFWIGAVEPHQAYDRGIGLRQGKKREEARMLACWPDLPEIRAEVLDYSTEIEHVDRHVGRALAALEKAGELDRTLIVFTSDHGNPLPRSKCNLYDSGTRVPLLVRYPPRVKGGRVVTDLVSLTDAAPTLLESAGLPAPKAATGRSLWPTLTSTREGRVDRSREQIVMAFERHTVCRPNKLGYPMRGLRTPDFLYIRNYEPDRWPAGDPDIEARPQGFSGDIDRGATKELYFARRDDPGVMPFFDRAIGRRPAEELYDLQSDPDQLKNVAALPKYESKRKELAGRLEAYLKETGDPRQKGLSPWDGYAYNSPNG
jgi:N-sulfoglucosamine sulfohydrolase